MIFDLLHNGKVQFSDPDPEAAVLALGGVQAKSPANALKNGWRIQGRLPVYAIDSNPADPLLTEIPYGTGTFDALIDAIRHMRMGGANGFICKYAVVWQGERAVCKFLRNVFFANVPCHAEETINVAHGRLIVEAEDKAHLVERLNRIFGVDNARPAITKKDGKGYVVHMLSEGGYRPMIAINRMKAIYYAMVYPDEYGTFWKYEDLVPGRKTEAVTEGA